MKKPRKTRLAWTIGFLLILLITVGVTQQLLSQSAKLTWLPDKVSVTLRPGDFRNVGVYVGGNIEVENLTFTPVPALQPFLTLTPDSIFSLSPEESQNLEISILVPENTTPGVYEGTIHGRTETSRRTIARPLQVTINVVTTLPVLPGPEEVISAVADAFEAGDIDAALQHFAISRKRREALRNVELEKHRRLGADLRNARLKRTIREGLVVYEVPYTGKEGTVRFIEFSLARVQEGGWKITTW